MRIVHFGHACVLLETAGERILLDPGTLSNGFEGERELSAVLITHQHFDHLDAERLPKILEANPNAKLIVDPGSAPAHRWRGTTSSNQTTGNEARHLREAFSTP